MKEQTKNIRGSEAEPQVGRGSFFKEQGESLVGRSPLTLDHQLNYSHQYQFYFSWERAVFPIGHLAPVTIHTWKNSVTTHTWKNPVTTHT